MPTRKQLRLPKYDYSRAGAYFVTVCLSSRRRLLGRVIDDTVELSALGDVVADELQAVSGRHPGTRIDISVVMPDHVRCVILLAGGGASLGGVVGTFKSGSARRVNALRRTPGEPFWQRGFFDHVVRDEDDLHRVRTYIAENPVRWTVRRAQEALLRKTTYPYPNS